MTHGTEVNAMTSTRTLAAFLAAALLAATALTTVVDVGSPLISKPVPTAGEPGGGGGGP
jgi:hypothetical protein